MEKSIEALENMINKGQYDEETQKAVREFQTLSTNLLSSDDPVKRAHGKQIAVHLQTIIKNMGHYEAAQQNNEKERQMTKIAADIRQPISDALFDLANQI